VYPRDRVLTRVVLGTFNLLHALVRHPFRAYVHETEAVEARLEGHGMVRSFHRETMLWQVAVFRRQSVTADSARPGEAATASSRSAPSSSPSPP
jgi:hypothetical protein